MVPFDYSKLQIDFSMNGTRFIKVFSFFVLACFFPAFGNAQYSLNESGITFGGGPAILSAQGNSKVYPGYEAGFFYSHYFCGKKFGLHGELATRGMNGKVPEEWNTGSIEKGNLYFQTIEGGFYFKLRPHTYHRPKESGILIGPRGAFILLAKNVVDGKFNSLSRVGADAKFFVPAIHFSGWIRRPFGDDDGSYFIRPGFNVYLSPILDYSELGINPMEYNYLNYFLFVELGIRLWNDR